MTNKEDNNPPAAGELTTGNKEKNESIVRVTPNLSQEVPADKEPTEPEEKHSSSAEADIADAESSEAAGEERQRDSAEKEAGVSDTEKSETAEGKDAASLVQTIPESSEEALKEDKKPETEAMAEEESEPQIENSGSENSSELELPSEQEAEAEAILQEKGEDENPETYYAALAEKAKELGSSSDWSYATSEFDNLYFQWGQGPDATGLDLSGYRSEIDRLKEELNEKKRAHYEEQQQKRLRNLEKKKELLKQFRELLEAEKWSNTRDVDRIRNRWEQIRQVPAEEAEKLENSFQAFMRVFDEHKVDRLVKMKQQEEDNLTLKLVILERMEALPEGAGKETEWKELEKKLNEFVRQFRKIGRIPSEKNKEIWDRFYTAQDKFSSKRFEFDSGYRKEIEAFLSKKKKLIDEAEALLDSDDLADAARRVNKLHRRWKKIGNLPQKDENELWDRFKAATDAFNEKKSENIDELREQEEKNFTVKTELIQKAEELKESEAWEETHKQLQGLMESWKKIGPVPRRKSAKIWKQFKGAMDHFYERRRDFFKEVKEERKDNLKEKQQVIDKLKELVSHENATEAVELAKPLQEEFKKAGYVPIKHKNRLWKEYREVCDEIYERFRATREVAEIVGKEKAQEFSAGDLTDIKKKQQQTEQLSRQLTKMNGELIQMKESLSYFKEGKKGNPLLDQARERIATMEKQISGSEEKLRQLEMDVDKLKKGI